MDPRIVQHNLAEQALLPIADGVPSRVNRHGIPIVTGTGVGELGPASDSESDDGYSADDGLGSRNTRDAALRLALPCLAHRLLYLLTQPRVFFTGELGYGPPCCDSKCSVTGGGSSVSSFGSFSTPTRSAVIDFSTESAEPETESAESASS
ncbi:hypothetical protein PC110_g13184 [Phytophthora cactorum]|nr:hypothetical protein PC110_g13184 [Phytophthora cactorum]